MLELLWPRVCAGCKVRHQGWLCPECTPGMGPLLEVEAECVRRGWGVAPYRSPVGRAVRVAKYRPDRRLMFDLGALLAERLGGAVQAEGIDAIVPAPSSWTRRGRRGFASAAILAHVLARRFKLPLHHALWVRRGPGQAGLQGSARARNLRGRLRLARAVRGRVLVVDDVLTTGSTASSCARELLGEGADAVFVGVLCVTARQQNTTDVGIV